MRRWCDRLWRRLEPALDACMPVLSVVWCWLTLPWLLWARWRESRS